MLNKLKSDIEYVGDQIGILLSYIDVLEERKIMHETMEYMEENNTDTLTSLKFVSVLEEAEPAHWSLLQPALFP